MSLEVMYERCAGIDVHQRFVVVCLIVVEGGKWRQEIRTFRNETADLLALRTWLVQEHCTHVGMKPNPFSTIATVAVPTLTCCRLSGSWASSHPASPISWQIPATIPR
jgi:hypothetical protein